MTNLQLHAKLATKTACKMVVGNTIKTATCVLMKFVTFALIIQGFAILV